MSFLLEYLRHSWGHGLKATDTANLNAWNDYLDAAEKDRQRDRILAWRDRTAADDFAANAEEPEYYRRTAGFVWRIKDAKGTHKARDHQYLYNLEVYGHQQFTRRDKSELSKAQDAVASKVADGRLGPLSPLD